jgi:hydroxymethylglutaryl-CoA lyase
MSNRVVIEEQGLRDGLQTLPITIPVDVKIRWITQLAMAGLTRLQVTSFVNPALVPQMADAEELCRKLPALPGVVLSALVLNVKGVERAAGAGLRHLAVSLSASNTHSLKNARKTIAEAKTSFAEMMQQARQHHIMVRGGVQCAFGCRYEGKIAKQVVLDLVKHHLNCGVQELALADSTGMANPAQVKEMMYEVLALCGDVPVALHLHNTENKGYANLVAALETGVRQFDTAFGGLGGCPFIKGATGNIATEDTVHLLRQMDYETGVDVKAVAAVSREMTTLLGQPLPGLLYELLEREDIQMT